MNLAGLYREASFAVSRTGNWRSRLSLLLATARFHLGNRLGLRSRAARPVDVDITLGAKAFSVRLRPHTGDVFIFYEVLAFDAYALPDEYLPPGGVRTIVDCGANVGITSIFFSERYPDARIFAVEPDPENFALLQRNTAAIDRIVPLRAAIVGSRRGRVRFSTDRPAWGNRVLGDTASEEHVEVEAVTIDELMQDESIEHIDILKVDIEGGEIDLFRNPDFLSKVDLLMIELHDEYSITDFRTAVAPFGFCVEAAANRAGPLTARRSRLASGD